MAETGAHIRDGLLVLDCQLGDPAAFEALVGRWQPRLEAHARRITGNPEAARDVVQETWLAVIRELPGLRDVEAFPKWVLLIVARRAIDWVRRQQRARSYADEVRDSSHPSRVDGKPPERMVRLEQALEALDLEQKALVSLHYFEGFGVDELAVLMRLPVGTIKSRLFHARQRIRKLMEVPSNV